MIVETKRLFLREYKDGDFSALHAIFSDAETMKHYPAPFSEQKTKDWMARNQKRYMEDGYGLWAVCLKETGEVIGDCGLVKQLVDGQYETEIGYHIAKAYWSKGFASEAAMACKEYGFQQLGLKKVISIIDPANAPSIRVAEKIGLALEREAYLFQKMHLIYSRMTGNV